ncbi:hypothetical protein PM082_003880 [Marasmius tenuissimus]|nr:hypothetical protein PM082_003880 [Marasmius tenuissimus]
MMRLWKVFQADTDNPRECTNPQCTPPLSHEPRRGSESQVGDIMCIRISALAPFYNLLGDSTDRGCKLGDRPCIITSIKTDGTFQVCLMATFDKNSYEEVPALFKEFIVLVSTTNPSDKTSLNTRLRHIHTIPEWTVPGSGRRGSQYLITLPINVSLNPLKKWRTPDMPSDAGFFIDETTVSKLDEIIREHENRSKEWLIENGNMKISLLLTELQNSEKTYRARNRVAGGDHATMTSKRTWGTRGKKSVLSAGFTPLAEGGTKDVDGYIVVGPDGKEIKPKSRQSRAPSSRAPSAVSNTYAPRRGFGMVLE